MTSGAISTGVPALAVRTVPVDDPGDLLTHLPRPDGLAWVRRGEGLVGWGEAARVLVGTGPDRLARAAAELAELFAEAEVSDPVGTPGSGPVAFGAITFDPLSAGSTLRIPAVVLGRRDGRSWLTTIGSPGAPPLVPRSAARPAPGPVLRPVAVAPAGIRYTGSTLPDDGWLAAVRSAVEAIRAGRLDKVVLARDLYAEAPGPLDPRAVAGQLAERFPDCHTFAVDGLVGATPELLVRRTGQRVQSLVLAGSAPRGLDAAGDAALGAGLLASVKDRQEHALAVESVRGPLEPLCDRLAVDPAPWLLRLANVQHLATRVRGSLVVAASAFELAAALHPTAAVCGTPTEAALATIRELEGMDRGRYSGPVGWVDAAGNGEWGIALRCAELRGNQARLFAGGGIVADSDPAAELAETRVKLQAVQSAL